MADVIVFRLEAPIAAFGDIAVGVQRGTHRRPSATGVLGLVGAALGLARDCADHERLANQWRVATRMDGLGAPLADFHTAQAPPQRKGHRFATRRSELADARKLSTVVSRRDHWTDAAFTIALWPGGDPPDAPDAHAIAAALARPRWALYAGRRACPLSRPVCARVVRADTLQQAFAAWDAQERAARARAGWDAHAAGSTFAVDASFAPGGALARAFDALAVERRETRQDELVNRRRWQFAPRQEALARGLTPQTEATP